MGLFSSSKKSTTNLQTVTNNNERTVAIGSETSGSVVALDGSRVTVTDQGAVAEAFDFGRLALDGLFDAFQRSDENAASAVNRSIAAVTEASRGEIEATVNNLARYALIGTAIYFISGALVK